MRNTRERCTNASHRYTLLRIAREIHMYASLRSTRNVHSRPFEWMVTIVSVNFHNHP